MLKEVLRSLFKGFSKLRDWSEDIEIDDAAKNSSIYHEEWADSEEGGEIHSLWDFLKFRENSQAFHLNAVIGFEEWVSMEEIKRRILELFGVNYKNDRSLYPYIKTLVDAGLFETLDVDGRRKWRKKDLIVKIQKKKEKEGEKAKAAQRAKSKAKSKQG